MNKLTRRRRALLEKPNSSIMFPYSVTVLMTSHTICLNGTISVKTDWRSSGYIPIPVGATKVKWDNSETGPSNKGRIGGPTNDTQTSDIPMINNGDVAQENTFYDIPLSSEYVYISRNGASEVDINVTFINT